MSTFIFDLDGTVYRDDVVLPGARETIETLRRHGHRVLFASNNSTRTREEYARKLAQMGLTIEPGGLVTSAYTTGVYLRRLPDPPRSLLIVGAAHGWSPADRCGCGGTRSRVYLRAPGRGSGRRADRRAAGRHEPRPAVS